MKGSFDNLKKATDETSWYNGQSDLAKKAGELATEIKWSTAKALEFTYYLFEEVNMHTENQQVEKWIEGEKAETSPTKGSLQQLRADNETLKEIQKLAQKVIQYYTLDLDGTSYDIPKNTESENIENKILDDFYVYLSDKDFIETYGKRLGITATFENDDFDENGNFKSIPFSMTDTYKFTTNDNGEVAWDFYGKEDTQGEGDITNESPEATELLALLNNGGWNTDDLEFNYKKGGEMNFIIDDLDDDWDAMIEKYKGLFGAKGLYKELQKLLSDFAQVVQLEDKSYKEGVMKGSFDKLEAYYRDEQQVYEEADRIIKLCKTKGYVFDRESVKEFLMDLPEQSDEGLDIRRMHDWLSIEDAESFIKEFTDRDFKVGGTMKGSFNNLKKADGGNEWLDKIMDNILGLMKAEGISLAPKLTEKIREIVDKAYEDGFEDGHNEGMANWVKPKKGSFEQFKKAGKERMVLTATVTGVDETDIIEGLNEIKKGVEGGFGSGLDSGDDRDYNWDLKRGE